MIQYTKDTDGIAIINLDNKDLSVNVINPELISLLDKNVSEALSDSSIKGIIITSSKKDFMVGADLKMFANRKKSETTMEGPSLHSVLRKIEKGGKPVVAAINGTALGGGYELALACHHRIAVNDAKTLIGLPEVLVGLLPGGGGTQRLPRMIGIMEALPLLLEGKKLRPDQALKIGMVNSLVNSQAELIPAAKEWILKVGKATQPWDEEGYKIPGGGINTPKISMMLPAAAGLLLKKTYGNYPAPIAIMNCVYEGMQLDIDKGLKVEARYFLQCLLSPESKGMIRTMFINMTEANKGEARPKGIPETNIKKIGVLGAGMMGAGIAYVSALNGLDVVLKDVTIESAEKGKAYSVKLLSEKLSKNQLTKEKYDEILNRITTTANPADIKDCDFVIEAVFESRELKATVTKESESVISSNAVFASNTSTLPITGLAKASSRPSNFIGLHFFSPVDKMQLVEIILGAKTSDYATAMAIDYVKKIKKTPIVVNDGRGFFTSRVFGTYISEGVECLAEGVSPALIENAGKMAGMPVGPLAVADEVSIELSYKINKQFEKDSGKVTEGASIALVKKLVEEYGRLGKKAKKGYYEYPEGGKKYLWPELTKLFPQLNPQPDVKEVIKRILYRQALEAVKCYEENIITKPADADIGSILGWGFAPYTGGILSFIEGIGIPKFVDECNVLAKKYGKRFKPTKKLIAMAAEGKSFYQKKEVEIAENV
jgi:3-hydroxyacyl-CoA dehydrogenase/enoyl-CoA hydratase/3-hydroxybutyryl-CoA epimerase